MGKLLNYLGQSKILKRIADVLNVTDVKVNNSSVVDNNGVANLTIPDAQIQSDWAQTDNTKVDFIKNKPTIPSGQIQSDWNQADTTKVDYIKNKPTIPTITDTYDGTSSDGMSGIAVQSAIDALPEPMVFKGSLGTGGTITTLPTDGSASIGDTYKVIEAGTYAGQAADIGDTFICDSKTSVANTWTLIPSGDEPSGTVTSITIKATSPIKVNSSSAITTSGTRTLSHENSGATAGSYGDSSAQTPSYGDTFKVPYVEINATGHVTGISEHTVAIPASDNTDEKVTSSANHYSPSTATGEDKTASASGGTAAWGTDIVTGVTLNTDGKGHVTGLSVTSGKVPASNPVNALDVTVTGMSASKTLATLTELNGKIAATFQDIAISESQVTNLTTDLSNKANISDIPTTLADLSDDSTHRLVTDTEKSTWNAKADISDIPTDYAHYIEVDSGNLDNFKTTGFYRGIYQNTCTNKPTGIGQFGLQVVMTAGTQGGSYRQILWNPTGSLIYTRICNNGTWGTWIEVKWTDEKVKQSPSTTDAYYRVLASTSENDTEETGVVKKLAKIRTNPSTGTTFIDGNFTADRKNGAAPYINPDTQQEVAGTAGMTYLIAGNNKAWVKSGSGGEGNSRGVLRLFGSGTNYMQLTIPLYATMSSDLSYYFQVKPTKSMFAMLDDLDSVYNDYWNLLHPPYYHDSGTTSGVSYYIDYTNGSVVFSGTASATYTFNIKRYTQMFKVPAGTYRLSGCPSGGSESGTGSDTYSMRVGTHQGTSSINWLGYDTGNGFEFTLTEESMLHIVASIYKNYAIQDTLIFTPTLTKIKGGWVDLGILTSGSFSVSPSFSELMITGTADNWDTVTLNIPTIVLASSIHFSSTFYMDDTNYIHLRVVVRIDNNNIVVQNNYSEAMFNGALINMTIRVYAKV